MQNAAIAADSTIFFVTGASGFVGRNLCRQLIHSGHSVHALVRRGDAYLQRLGVKLWLGDLWDATITTQAIGAANVVIHCAGDPSFGNGPQYFRANVQLTEHLIAIVKEHCPALSRFVFVSTIGAIDRRHSDDCRQPLTEESPAAPTSDYGRSKLQAEIAVQQSGLPFSIVRPSMVVGPDMRFDSHFAVFARHAINRSALGRIAWPGRFSVVHIDDLSGALEFVATHSEALGKTFFCAGETISIAAYFAMIEPRTGRIPLGWVVALIRPLRQWLPFSLKAMLLPALSASDKCLRQLGWQPRYDASSALLEVITRERARLDPTLDPGGQTVITGAASGLGRALVDLLAPIRKRLLIVDRDIEGLRAVAAQFQNCQIAVADLTIEEELLALMRGDAWSACPISEIYACAGIGFRGTVQDTPFESHRKMFDLNVLARIALAHNAVAGMQRNQQGRVVFISSSSAFQPLPSMATYAATNSALLSISEAWSHEIAGQGVHMMAVCPGGMQTNFQKSGGVKNIEGEKLMSPHAVAQAILHGLQKRRATLIVSFRSFAMSMLARLLPRAISVRLWGKLMEKMR